jgi:cobalamin biosynthesis protein CobD/CbiB
MLNAVHETQEIGLIWQLGLVSLTFGVFYFTSKLQLPIEQVLHYYAMILLLWYLLNVAILIRISKGSPLFYQRRRLD